MEPPRSRGRDEHIAAKLARTAVALRFAGTARVGACVTLARVF